MDTDVPQCPENSNSTDCLLRTLLQLLTEYREADNATIDWDPINFAITLLIGLVAILFALATVIQAIFAAEKGRRRTSQLAIGKWFRETEREWDWSEMNFRYTVTTPILHEESLLSLERYDKQGHSTDNRGSGNVVQRVEPKFPASVKNIASYFHLKQYQQSEAERNQPRRPSAAWLDFFKEVGLDESDVTAWGSYTRKIVADYLPDDVTAAPAYAQVGAIVAAAVTAGIQKVDIDKQASRNYPILVGQGFQIDFRQHPALGVVGAYSRYNETSKELGRLNMEELRSAMNNGRGFVDDQKTMDLSTESTRRQLIEVWSQLGRAHAISCASWRATFALNLSAISEAHLPLITGMFADRPKYVPALFPTAMMKNNNCLTTLALSSKYWAEVHLGQFRVPEVSRWSGPTEMPSWNGFVWPYGKDWESTMSGEVHRLYNKLNIEERVTTAPWLRDVEEFYALIKMKFELRLLVEAEERDAAERAQREREQAQKAGTKGEIERQLAEEDEQATASRTRLEDETTVAEAFGARPQAEKERAAEAEARLSIGKSATNSEASDGIPTDSQQESKAEATIGHGLVLQTCLQLLHESALLEKWFSEASSDSLKFLRRLVHEQIKEVDRWLSEREGIRHRSILLCNTTIVLLRLEQMIADNFFDSSGLEEPQGHEVQSRSVEQQQTQSSNRRQPEQGIASGVHFNTLQVLRNMVDGLHEKGRGASELKKLLHNSSDSTLLWDRLKALVVYHSKDETGWQVRDQFKHEDNKNEPSDLDDVIIYRCLMMVLLFRTATDSSKILESGIWDQVVPII